MGASQTAGHDRRVGSIVDLLVPPTCAGCGLEGDVLCGRCRGPLYRRLREPPGLPIGLPGELPEGLVQLEWCAAYTGTVRAALHILKYGGERRLADPLGAALAARWRSAGAAGTVLVPVPVHAARLRARGYDQALLLALSAGRSLGIPVARALRRTRSTRAQYQLGKAGRAENVGGMFEVVPDLVEVVSGRWVVVVDDILTTGATLAACAHALSGSGAAAVAGLTVARER
jgi:ComF family protein